MASSLTFGKEQSADGLGASLDPDETSGSPRPARQITRGLIGLHAGVIGGLILVGIIMWWRVWVSGNPLTTVPCQCGDISEAVGFLAWPPWALLHGHNPFLSNALYAGQGGVNMLDNGSWMFFGLVFAPITWAFGPVATFNVVVTLAPAVSGWCFFLAVRKFTRFVPGQIAATALYGVSPIIVTSEPFGHFFQIWLIYPPLVFLCLYDLFVTQRFRPVRLGIVLGLLTVVQFFSSTEVLLISGVVAIVGMIASAALAPRTAWARRRNIVTGLAVALGTAALLLAYPIWFALDGPRHIVGFVWPRTPTLGAVGSGVISAGPDTHQPAANDIVSGYYGNRGPDDSYIGIAVLVFLGLSSIAWFKNRLAWVIVVVGVASWSFSLGSSNSWSLWRVLQHVPVLSDIIPGRIGAMTVFAAALLLALSADSWWRLAVQYERRRRGRPHQQVSRHFLAVVGTCLALVTAATLIPVAATYSFPYVIFPNPIPMWFRHVAPNLAPRTVLLVYPFPEQVTAQAMGWQAVDGMGFRLVGGFAIVPGADGKHSAFVSIPGGAVGILDLLSLRYLGPLPLATPTAVSQVRAAVHHWGVQDVVVTTQGRDPVYAVGFLTAVMGRLPSFQLGAWVWHGLGNHPPLSIDPSTLTNCVTTSPSFYSKDSDKLSVPKCVLAAGRVSGDNSP